MGVTTIWSCDRCGAKTPSLDGNTDRAPEFWKFLNDPRVSPQNGFVQIVLCPKCTDIISVAIGEAEELKMERLNRAFRLEVDVKERQDFRKRVANG